MLEEESKMISWSNKAERRLTKSLKSIWCISLNPSKSTHNGWSEGKYNQSPATKDVRTIPFFTPPRSSNSKLNWKGAHSRLQRQQQQQKSRKICGFKLLNRLPSHNTPVGRKTLFCAVHWLALTSPQDMGPMTCKSCFWKTKLLIISILYTSRYLHNFASFSTYFWCSCTRCPQ